jgi:pimeloyl-ACP methyl ester carboxylesterase
VEIQLIMEIKKQNQEISLNDGRTLGFAEYGSENGEPIFYFSGGNSSRIEGAWFEKEAIKRNIRLIAPDRPGFGLSSFQKNRELIDWSNDVIELADNLSINKFSIFGLSGGGPHVLAMANSNPERLKKVAIISGTAPPEMPNKLIGMWPPVKLIFSTAEKFPKINRFLLKQMAGFYSNEEQMLKRMKQALPKPDVALIENRPEIIKIFAISTKEAHRNGVDGDALEWQLYVNPWKFNLEDIQKEIKLWYGRYDQQVPIEMGRYISKKLPNGKLVEVENGGHFSTINNFIVDIFEYLVE